MDDEIRRHAQRAQRGQQDRSPSVVRLSRARVQRVMISEIRIGVFASRDYDADFYSRVNRLHGGDVISRGHRVGERIMLSRVRVGFPRALVFIAYLPVFEPVPFGYIRVTHPFGSFLRGSRPIIDADESLRVYGSCDGAESIKASGPLPRIVVGCVGLPVIVIRKRTTGEASYSRVVRREK